MFSETQRALSHVKEVASGAQCHVPLKKVIRVTTSSPDLEYFPSCTVLYRCSEDTGCCTETERCVAKSKTTISRHFYVSSSGVNRVLVIFCLLGSASPTRLARHPGHSVRSHDDLRKPHGVSLPTEAALASVRPSHK